MDKGIGLVLAGGGAKGSYQVGAWQALREMGISFQAVIGTSVGALNAALVAQGDLDLAEQLWREVSIRDVIQWHGEKDTEPDSDSLIKTDLFLLSRYIRGGAFSMQPLRDLIEKYLDEEKIRTSGMEFGLVTFNLSDMKPHVAFLEDIPQGKMTEWLMASACLPAFKPLEVDGKKYVDGAVYNNFPVEPLYERGYRQVVSIDISGIGRTKSFEAPDLQHTRIRNSEFLGGTLQFSQEISIRNMLVGYCDALKVYGKMGGCRYNYRCADNLRHLALRVDVDLDATQISIMTRLSHMTTRRILHRMRTYSDCRHATLNVALEITAELLEVDRYRIYTMESFLEAIHAHLEALKKTRQELTRNSGEGLWEWLMRIAASKESMTAIIVMQAIGAGMHLDEVAVLGKASFMALEALTLANPDLMIATMVIYRLLKGFGIDNLPQAENE